MKVTLRSRSPVVAAKRPRRSCLAQPQAHPAEHQAEVSDQGRDLVTTDLEIGIRIQAAASSTVPAGDSALSRLVPFAGELRPDAALGTDGQERSAAARSEFAPARIRKIFRPSPSSATARTTNSPVAERADRTIFATDTRAAATPWESTAEMGPRKSPALAPIRRLAKMEVPARAVGGQHRATA